MKADSVLGIIGNTPHIRLSRLFPGHRVWIKLECTNPGGSIKDRIALGMIEDAERSGHLKPGGVIIEPTSGNTGIGLAMVGAVKGYRVVLVMPESMSEERRKILAAYGAELILTPREKGMNGAIERACQVAASVNNPFMPMQFENMANPAIHAETTAREILSDFPDGFDYLVTGIGTGGHISGVGERLKQHANKTRVFGVEPVLSAVLSGGDAGPHPLQGIGAGFVPSTLNERILDGVITVGKDEAYTMVRHLARKEGLLAGVSTGASLAAIEQKLPSMAKGSSILTFAYDTGERYLSVDGLFVS